jgi:hypothetical protein
MLMTNAEEISISPLSEENQKFAYEMLRKEIEATRDKAWKIFSWTTTILLGTIGGANNCREQEFAFNRSPAVLAAPSAIVRRHHHFEPLCVIVGTPELRIGSKAFGASERI